MNPDGSLDGTKDDSSNSCEYLRPRGMGSSREKLSSDRYSKGPCPTCL
ncbi:hypothetical protein EYF80_043293 [Liparis tanakae]|uniref:Uncharacterized protein n=1 Tax=Liparis tanakae TaxID=230148 RepID=A0A4Z2G057_9TELE|nr:hypothetical protein EYF80_043293 [Liparis tanakae]